MSTDINHLAWLARIKVSDNEVKNLQKRIEAAMKIVDKLLKARVDNIEPLYHPQEGISHLRDDEAIPFGETCEERRRKMLSNANRLEKGFVVAPRTVED